ncbi:hypothetical protein [Streptomyces sp. MS1.AVA.4]|uniref:Uncharacterized protein n=1 Tax=Streptomyces pratisoli TaxID=3139917 RepID=A0ACC6Q9M6_9ACTN
MSVDMWLNVSASEPAALACLVFAPCAPDRRRGGDQTRSRHLMTVSIAFALLILYTVLITVWPGGRMATVLWRVRTAVVSDRCTHAAADPDGDRRAENAAELEYESVRLSGLHRSGKGAPSCVCGQASIGSAS